MSMYYDSLDKSDFCYSFTKEKRELGHSINSQFRFLYLPNFLFVDVVYVSFRLAVTCRQCNFLEVKV